MTTARTITGIALLLFSCLANAEMWTNTWHTNDTRTKLRIDDPYYKSLVGYAVPYWQDPSILPGEEFTVICDGSFSNLTGQTVTLSSKIRVLDAETFTVLKTILPAQPLYFTAERLREGINRTGIWVADAIYQSVLFQCEYRATSIRWDGSNSFINISNATIFVQRRAP